MNLKEEEVTDGPPPTPVQTLRTHVEDAALSQSTPLYSPALAGHTPDTVQRAGSRQAEAHTAQ